MALRADISARPRSRGRPKGTGIDDRDSVVRVQALLASDQSLKPTTAIKRIGITDPSVIRRLRDKLEHFPTKWGSGSSKKMRPIQDIEPTTQPLRTATTAKSLATRAQVASAKKSPPPPPARVARAPTPRAPEAAAVTQPTPPTVPPNALSDQKIAEQKAAEQKARETALLAAYLQAMQQSQAKSAAEAANKPAQRSTPEPKPEPQRTEPQRPETRAPEPPKTPASPFPFAGMPGFPAMPNMAAMQGMMPNMMPNMISGLFPGMPPTPGAPNPMQAFSIPGFPSFLQPFQQKQAAPQPGTDQARQLEALKLAVEATTAIARFQLHLVENAAAYSPMAMMLQGQSFIGQMMIAGLTGQLGALHRQMTTPAPAGGEKK